MRVLDPVVVAAFLLLAGCMGAPSPPEIQPSATGPAAPRLDILVTDPEFVPIPGAAVFVQGRDSRGETDALGALALATAPGPFEVRAWAPSYYRNATLGDTGEHATTQVHVVLERRPGDRAQVLLEEDEGLCWLAVASAFGGVSPCMTHPTSCGPTGCHGPTASLSVALPGVIHEVTLRLEWEGDDVSQEIAFELRRSPPAPFADGSDALLVSGSSPLVVELSADELGSVSRENGTILRIGSVLPPEWERPLVYEQAFRMQARLDLLYQAPPNPPW